MVCTNGSEEDEDGGVFEAVPENEPQDAPENEPQDAPEDEPQVVPENEPQNAPEDELQVVPEAEPQDEPQVVPEEEPQVVPVVEPQVVPEVIPEVEPQVVPEVEPAVEPQVVPEDEPQEVPENEPDLEEISEDDWNQMFKKGKFKKADMDKMVMDFLIDQELPIVAEAFHKESGCPMGIDSEDLTKVGAQKIVRDLILNRQIDDAIQTINDTMTRDFFYLRPQLRFYLEQQKMIELCRSHDFNAALNFSRKFIIWESFDQAYFQRECRLTLLLMLFGDDEESPASAFLDYCRIVWLAKCAVDTMINYQGRRKGKYIEKAAKMVIWEEDELYQVVKIPCFEVDSGYPKL